MSAMNNNNSVDVQKLQVNYALNYELSFISDIHSIIPLVNE